MKRALRWALGATLAASACALWWPQPTTPWVAAVERSDRERVATPGRTDASLPLPATIAPLDVEPARRDFFVPELAAVPPPPVVTAVAPVPVPVTQPIPVIPSPPAINVRYVGTMVTPEGKRMVMLSQGDAAITVQAGTPLSDGYVVESLTPTAVRLVYPPLGTRIDVPIPDFEMRP